MSAFYEDSNPSRSYVNAAAGPSARSPPVSYAGLYSSEHMSASMTADEERFGDADEEKLPTQTLQSPYQPSRSYLDPPESYTDYTTPIPSSLSTGRRAPAPAPLELSPQSAYKARMGVTAQLGYGPPPGRVVSDPALDKIPSRSYRPLPQPPTTSGLLPSPRPSKTAPTTPAVFTTPHVSLAAVGRLSDAQRPHSRPSIDSYYLRSEHTPYFPPPSQAFTPITPDPTDIDRRGLVGVGEMATPRWASSSGYLQAPGPPSNHWAGHGLGVGVMQSAPSAPALRPSDDLSTLLTLESFADFSFDADMAAALAASLAISEEQPPDPQPGREAVPEARVDPEPRREFLQHRAPSRNARPPLNDPHASAAIEIIPATGSPGSARSRIYARRQAAALAQQTRAPPPELTPPTSADSSGFARKTPPNREREGKTRHSPSSAHHDILKHFAPKDFSHLPPSPSSASIKQFLKGSGSVQNIASIGTPPASITSSYFPSSIVTAPSKSSLQRSNSGKLRTLSKSGGVVDTDTAEALRKLDGLGNGKKAKPKMSTGSSGTPPKPRSAVESPLQDWYDVAEELPPADKRDLPSSAGTSEPSAHPKRRASGGSEVSSDPPDNRKPVPPVPPLPKGYVSVRQGLASYVPLAEPAREPSPPLAPEPRKALTKKWSFSSALSLKLRDSPPATGDLEEPHAWSEIAELPSPGITAVSARSDQTTTPVAQNLVPVKGPPGKRLTPSSIPFFRQRSSSSVLEKPETPKIIPAPVSTRKSVLGLTLPSMLRGSASKRGLSQQITSPPVQTTENEERASTGWTGRKRGKTLSISDGPPIIAKPSAFVESGSSVQSDQTDVTIKGVTGLPSIAGSPAPRVAPPSPIPTKIPRMVNRPGGSPSGSMPPPAFPHTARTTSMVSSASTTNLSRVHVSEFGSVGGQRTAGSHRAHLLAPMSTRQEKKPEKMREPLVRVTETGGVVPPSRRNLPIPPMSSVTAMTASALAKRTSQDTRPGMSRQSSSSGRSSGATSPMKPSKSMHSKLSVPTNGRMTSSFSVGASGVGYRKSSLVAESSGPSPSEDEEALGDAEMQAYVERRRAKQTTSSGRKDDLADVTEFPEDTEPAEPVSQRTFITKNLAIMSDFERKEVFDFDIVYYTAATPRPSSGGVTYNHGYDDERGDYLVVEGDHLCYRYEVVSVLGKGSFGQVLQCRDHKTGGSVAVKVIRNKKRFHAQALVEVKILQQLVEWDKEDKHNMVRMTEHFYFRSHLCIVTELLSINLYELIKANSFAGFSTVLIRRFTTQMLASLNLMRSHRIVHCDLKPENILLCHPIKSGIKVIDFGSSCLETEKVYTYIQSRFYRSPEVILGMNYAMAIDMWSLGCILAELYTGVPIFPGENEHEQLACIMEVLGIPERSIVERSSRRKLFFDAMGTPRPFVNAKGKRRRPASKTLASVLKCNDEFFVDFIAKCLTWDPDRRLKPGPAMRHPWLLSARRRPQPARPLLPASSSSSREKKSLLISPPTPLMARQLASTSRIGPSASSSRLTEVRKSTYMVGSGLSDDADVKPSAQKASLG